MCVYACMCVCVGGRLNTIWMDTFERSCMFVCVCVYTGSVCNSDQHFYFSFFTSLHSTNGLHKPRSRGRDGQLIFCSLILKVFPPALFILPLCALSREVQKVLCISKGFLGHGCLFVTGLAWFHILLADEKERFVLRGQQLKFVLIMNGWNMSCSWNKYVHKRQIV